MKRTNEAFKNEVFRRYRTEVRNRRNLRIYAASTLAVCLLVGGFAFSVFTGRIPLPAPVASLFDPPEQSVQLNELAKYFDDPVTDLEIVNIGGSTDTHNCTDAEAQNTVNLLTKLSLTPIDGNPPQSALLYRIRAKLPVTTAEGLRILTLVFYEDGILRVNYAKQNSDIPHIEYFQISEADFTPLMEYFKEKVGEPVPVTMAPELSETPDELESPAK